MHIINGVNIITQDFLGLHTLAPLVETEADQNGRERVEKSVINIFPCLPCIIYEMSSLIIYAPVQRP